MKVLFIGEGSHEIGHADTNPSEPQQAAGVLPALARRVCPSIAEDSLALRWTEIVRFNPAAKKKGLEGKVAAAIVLSARRFNCGGTICVHDQDRDPDRLPAMERGRERGLQLVSPPHAAVCGVAVESIEAWTLGAPSAIAEILQIELHRVAAEYSVGGVESLYQRSGKPEHRPKDLLERIAQLAYQTDSTDFRQAVAEQTDPAELERHCPTGFKPFADALRAAFATAP